MLSLVSSNRENLSSQGLLLLADNKMHSFVKIEPILQNEPIRILYPFRSPFTSGVPVEL